MSFLGRLFLDFWTPADLLAASMAAGTAFIQLLLQALVYMRSLFYDKSLNHERRNIPVALPGRGKRRASTP